MESYKDRLWIDHSPGVPWTVQPLDSWARGSPNVIKFEGRCCELWSAGNILGATLEVVTTRILKDEEEVNLQHQPLLVACYHMHGYVGNILPWRGHTPHNWMEAPMSRNEGRFVAVFLEGTPEKLMHHSIGNALQSDLCWLLQILITRAEYLFTNWQSHYNGGSPLKKPKER